MNERETTAEEREGAGDGPLLAVLRELIRTHGREETAELLDVSVRTLFRTVASGRLSPAMRKTLDLQLLADGSEPAQRQGAEGGALEQRVAGLEERVEELRESRTREPSGHGAGDGVRAREQSGLGTGDGARTVSPPAVQGVPQQDVIGRPAVSKPRRAYPQLVTLEPEDGEELLYGEATPLVVEWRRMRVDHLDKHLSRLAQATAWVRMRELELVLIGEHALTLPPAVYPWDRGDRRKELWWREESLRDARADRRWALCWRWLRRVLSLGLWRR